MEIGAVNLPQRTTDWFVSLSYRMRGKLIASSILVLTGLMSVGMGQQRNFVNQQQSTFSSEEAFNLPAKLPSSILATLKLVDGGELQRCQNNEEFPTLQRARLEDHFVASKLDVKKSTGKLRVLVVRSNSGCFNGAHAARFWLFAKREAAKNSEYKLIFETIADGLTVSRRSVQTFPNIKTISHTATKGYSTNFVYKRGSYRKQSCYFRDLGEEKASSHRINCVE